jgi:hypothetical protein
MLRLHPQVLVPTKNPRCRLAGEGARRDELLLSRHADVRGEAFLRCARRNNSRLGRRVNFARRYVLRSGRTVGCPSKRVLIAPSDVVSVDAPCRNRALPRCTYARMFRVTQSRIDLSTRHPKLGHPIAKTHRCQDSGPLPDSSAHDGCTRGTPRHRSLSLGDRPS